MPHDIPMEPEDQAVNSEDAHLRGIFLECDTSTSSLSSSGSIAPKISVPIVVGYIGDNLPNTPDEFLLELRKSLESVSSNGFVNWRQFKEASRLWVARLKELRWQDGNNNMHKTDFANVLIENLAKDTRISNRDYDNYGGNDEIQNLPALRELEDMDASTDFSNSSSPTMYDNITQSTMTDMTTGSSKKDTGGEVTEVELRLRVRRSYEENAVLRDELLNAEDMITSLRQQRDCLRRELGQTKKRCHQLEGENDEQREGLNEMIEKQRICTLSLQRVEKQRDFIQGKLENAELEMQSIPSMADKLHKLEKEKSDYMRQVAKIERELEEKQNECEALQTMVTQLQERTTALQEVNDRTIQCLREQNQQLAAENSELIAERSVLNGIGFDDGFSTSSVPSIGYCYAHSTPYKGPKLERQESLYDELKASGFTTECGGTTSRSENLEEELNWYDQEICGMLETIETVINELAASKNPAEEYIPSLRSDKEELAKTQAVETLKEKISFVQRTIAEVIKKDPAKDSSTQIASEPVTTDLLSQFGIQSFQDQLKFIRENPGTEVDSMNKGVPDESKENPFLKTTTAAVTAVQEDAIIGPIVAALDRIIRDTSSQQSSPTERSPSGNFRSRSIYTYTTCRPSEETTDNPADSTRGQLLAFGKGDCPSKGGTDEKCETLCQEILRSPDAQKLEVTEEQDVESMAEDTKFENTQDFKSKSQCVARQISSNRTEDEVSVDINESSSQISTSNNHEDGNEPPNDCGKVSVLLSKALFDRQPITDAKTLKKTFGSPKFSAYREKLEPALRTTPQRKISVFHRSFDVNMLENQVEEEKQAEMELPSFSGRSSFPEERKSEGMSGGSEFSGSSGACKYTFSDSYRPRIDSSGSSSSSSPRKSDTSTSEDLSFIEDSRRAAPRTITLNPPRLTLPRVNEDVLPDEKGENSASTNSSGAYVKKPEQFREKKIMSETVTIRTENSPENSADTRDSSIDANNYRYGNVDYRRTYSTADSNSSCSLLSPRDNENDKWILSENEQPCNNKLTSETYVLSPRSALSYTNEQESSEAKVKDPGYSPSSRRENSGGGGEPRTEQAVALAMSSREESSDSECEPQLVEANDTVGRTVDSLPSSGLSSSTPYTTPRNSARRTSTEFSSANDGPLRSSRSAGRNAADIKQTRPARQRMLSIRRSLSDGESNDNSRKECRCRRSSAQEVLKTPAEAQQRVFPSLTDGYLQESGIANLSDTRMETNESLSEEELQLKYTAFSLGLSTDRVTLSRRVALSIRQRDQAERNLSCEVQKMQQDIQELAPLCVDRESMERVERVRHQLDMIVQCAHRVSCAAETLGAVHQENRISRAVHLADKYLQTLRAKCEKLAKEIAETKQILLENNIVIEEHPSELGDDVPRILRYRSGIPANNRTMMAKRRASIATISRPLGSTQDVTKEGIRQRNSVSGRVTLRRPSLCYETPKWEYEKLDRSGNSCSTGELRGICEHAESRRNSREENNNVLGVNQTANHINTTNSGTVDGQVWNICKGESSLEQTQLENIHHESRLCLRAHDSFRLANNLPWRPMFWCILIFFFGFYVNQAISSISGCGREMYKWWSIEEILSQYIKVENAGPRPV